MKKHPPLWQSLTFVFFLLLIAFAFNTWNRPKVEAPQAEVQHVAEAAPEIAPETVEQITTTDILVELDETERVLNGLGLTLKTNTVSLSVK